MTQRAILLRSLLIAGVFTFLMSTAMTTMATAQGVIPCKCDVGTIYVGKVDCKFEVCIKDAEGTQCVTVGGGSTEYFKCHEQAIIYIVDCYGNIVVINNDKDNCAYCICVGRGCCVDACVGYDEKGCPYVKIGPTQTCKKC